MAHMVVMSDNEIVDPTIEVRLPTLSEVLELIEAQREAPDEFWAPQEDLGGGTDAGRVFASLPPELQEVILKLLRTVARRSRAPESPRA